MEVKKSLDNCMVQINANCSVFFHYNENSGNGTIYWERTVCKYMNKRTSRPTKKKVKEFSGQLCYVNYPIARFFTYPHFSVQGDSWIFGIFPFTETYVSEKTLILAYCTQCYFDKNIYGCQKITNL